MSSSPSSELPLHPSQNPSNWRFTWEAQSHIPTVRLYLFNPHIKPSAQCTNLEVDLSVDQSSLLVRFYQAEAEAEAEACTSFRVPLPRVLIDPESPVQFTAYDDHIHVKLALLLPIDHPLVSEFDSSSDEYRPLSTDSDLKNLSALEEVYFYCRSCSAKLTRSLRCFKEMPSVNWQEAADNWFGACCCSFGGISEKLVRSYAKSYTCAAGVCLLDTESVILCKDDLVGCEFPGFNWNQSVEFNLKLTTDDILVKASSDDASKHGQTVCSENDDFGREVSNGKEHHLGSEEENLKEKLRHEATGNAGDCGNLSCLSSHLQTAENMATCPDFHAVMKHDLGYCDNGCHSLDRLEISSEEKSGRDIELLEHQKVLLNGFLWNGFLARSSNLSKDVRWVEFLCPQCSSLLGAYPCFSDSSPLDSGIRLFKCHISTTLPVGGSGNTFRCYSLERMFAIQLLESAKDELSFRTVVRDMQTKYPMLQIVLLNPDSWCCSGCCLYSTESASRKSMYPTIKVLFSACCNDEENESRKLEEWITKNQADEVYMLPSQIGNLISYLKSANSMYPPSQVPLQNLSLSSMRR
ncbi:uncharacterized protein LOC113777965 [Coffea eugenioides]|uniref:uncharacterized protein LOC113777965 n=1 Tax=Coffea eugenioides TaxID=49369 RepID=UPI000F609FB8|nr:uncharacterized protein LOC113777965 [Coffea eugenioides]